MLKTFTYHYYVGPLLLFYIIECVRLQTISNTRASNDNCYKAIAHVQLLTMKHVTTTLENLVFQRHVSFPMQSALRRQIDDRLTSLDPTTALHLVLAVASLPLITSWGWRLRKKAMLVLNKLLHLKQHEMPILVSDSIAVETVLCHLEMPGQLLNSHLSRVGFEQCSGTTRNIFFTTRESSIFSQSVRWFLVVVLIRIAKLSTASTS